MVASPNELDAAASSSRDLGSQDNDNQRSSSYLVDADGNAYEPYSLAWRYLGMYIDCDIEESDGSSGSDNDVHRRNRRNLGSDDDGNDCSRRVLWAAYHDPKYRGGSIGEYKFYNYQNNTWDASTCQTKARCARMDCHEPRTHWKLVGVFKETDGLTDWAEQLFKHEGYCLWDADKEGDSGDYDSGDGGDGDSIYEFMSAKQQKWISSCTSMALTDENGNDLYLNIRPRAEGNMSYGLYYDEDCSQKASMSFAEYVIMYYSTYYGNEEKGYSAAQSWESDFESWNEYMTVYKICQPCRAYNRVPTYQDENEDEHRFLENNDGVGDDEQFGYNCYDGAGYKNCNQCYKFEAKTDLEVASTEDLVRASSQGTILAIKVDGVVYGSGGFVSEPEPAEKALYFLAVAAIVLTGALILYRLRSHVKRLWSTKQIQKQKLALPASFRERFCGEQKEIEFENDKIQANLKEKDEMLQSQREELGRLKVEVDRERLMRQLERSRSAGYVEELEKTLRAVASSETLEAAAEQAAIKHTALGTDKGKFC